MATDATRLKTGTLDPRLRCPEPGSPEDRVAEVLHGLARWITQEPIAELLEIFGRPVPGDWGSWPPEAVLDHLRGLEPWHERCTLWDYRGRAAARGERSDDGSGEAGASRLHDHEVTGTDDDRVLALAERMGLRTATDAREREYDAVVVLGGLRLSPKVRAQWAVRQLADLGVRAGSVVLLGSARPVQPAEREATETYAPGAATEFDLLRRAAVEAGLIDEWAAPTIARLNGNEALRSWEIHSHPGEVHVVSAPAAPPHASRPSTGQALEFMLSRPEFERARRILVVSNATCVPYQQVEAMRSVALPGNRVVELIAVPLEPTAHLPGVHRPHSYLQETRSMFQASLRLHADFRGPD